MKTKILIAAGTLTALIMGAFAMLSPVLADSDSSGRGRGGDDDERFEDGVRIPLRLRLDEADDILERFRQNNRFRADLALTNVADTSETGTVRLDAKRQTRLDNVKIQAKISNISAMTGTVLEGWLKDNQTGALLSLGGFEMRGSSAARLNFRQKMVNFFAYDKFMVTREPINDTNPAPATVILEADFSAVAPPVGNVITTSATLTGAKQVPVNSSTATGNGTFTINTVNNTLSFNISFSGLTGTETGAHIHGPATATQNAPVLFSLPLGSPKVGVWNYPEAQEADILAGRMYVNVHSTVFPDGEIRGQIVF